MLYSIHSPGLGLRILERVKELLLALPILQASSAPSRTDGGLQFYRVRNSSFESLRPLPGPRGHFDNVYETLTLASVPFPSVVTSMMGSRSGSASGIIESMRRLPIAGLGY